MNYDNKYALTKEQNINLAKSNLVNLVYTTSKLENLTVSFSNTKDIVEGREVIDIPKDDINTISDLKAAWVFAINHNSLLTLETIQEINKIVSLRDSLAPGNIRDGNSSVLLPNHQLHEPPIPDRGEEKEYLSSILEANKSTTEKALSLMYHIMRSQLFWDGNKRTATIAANNIMLNNGAGIINIPLNKWDEWNNLLSDFYLTNNIEKIKRWTYFNAINGY
ncbi:MAG: Fic family protein [Bacteroides sp.]|nr:Fic family protein [Bacteroides sp.]